MIFDDISSVLCGMTIKEAAERCGLPESKVRRMRDGCGFIMDRRTDWALQRLGFRIQLVRRGKAVYSNDIFTAMSRVSRGKLRETVRKSGIPYSKWRNVESVAAGRGAGWSLNLQLLLGLQRLGYDLKLAEVVQSAGTEHADDEI